MNFFKNFLSSLLAVVVGMGLVSMISTLIFVGIIASFGSLGSKQTAVIPDQAVLQLDMGVVTDAPASSIFEQFNFQTMTQNQRTTTLGAIRAIETAAKDERIRGIYMNLGENTALSMSTMEEVRAALVRFKESGKFIVAYEESYSQSEYWFASVADRIYLNPVGGIEWKGMTMGTMFYKGLLEKVGIKPVIFRHGTFKSAVEPFMLDKMSDANRMQYDTFVRSIWNFIVEGVSGSREIPAVTLQRFANELAINTAEDALDCRFVDGLRYEHEVMCELEDIVANGLDGAISGQLSGSGGNGHGETAAASAGESDQAECAAKQPYTEQVTADTETAAASDVEADQAAADEKTAVKEPDVKIVSFGDYLANVQASPQMMAKNLSKNKIAVIYAEGDIVSGSGEPGQVASTSMVEKIRKARTDEDVKAVVFRVNSPGGSALASDVMWHELTLLKAQKPLIVSMGSYAASGGYYISCPADVIYADRTTLTGSIGVFGLFAVDGGLADKLGVSADFVNTNRHSDMGNMFRTPCDAEMAYYQRGVEDIYATFIGHVADGRNMTPEAVDEIGQGRIWSGVNAFENGLVDGFGGITDAISLAADRSGIAGDFRVWEVTDTPTGIAAMFAGLSGGLRAAVRDYVMRDELGAAFAEYNYLRSTLSSGSEIQARLPYNVVLQ